MQYNRTWKFIFAKCLNILLTGEKKIKYTWKEGFLVSDVEKRRGCSYEIPVLTKSSNLLFRIGSSGHHSSIYHSPPQVLLVTSPLMQT